MRVQRARVLTLNQGERYNTHAFQKKSRSSFHKDKLKNGKMEILKNFSLLLDNCLS